MPRTRFRMPFPSYLKSWTLKLRLRTRFMRFLTATATSRSKQSSHRPSSASAPTLSHSFQIIFTIARQSRLRPCRLRTSSGVSIWKWSLTASFAVSANLGSPSAKRPRNLSRKRSSLRLWSKKTRCHQKVRSIHNQVRVSKHKKSRQKWRLTRLRLADLRT